MGNLVQVTGHAGFVYPAYGPSISGILCPKGAKYPSPGHRPGWESKTIPSPRGDIPGGLRISRLIFLVYIRGLASIRRRQSAFLLPVLLFHRRKSQPYGLPFSSERFPAAVGLLDPGGSSPGLQWLALPRT